jgi:dolichol-phosphate mannosyltransferase
MLSIIIPTFNEKKNILIISRRLLKLKIVSEIIFVDDSSFDNTFLEIKKIKNKKIKGYLRKKDRDLSKSVIFGIKRAKNRIVLVMDCDLQHDVKYIPKMWNKLKIYKCDIVIGSRFKKRNFSGNLGFIRSCISKAAISMISLIFGRKTSDPLSGFFMCKKELILNNENFFFAQGYKILFDILFNSQNNLKIIDQNIVFKKRNYEKSKFNFSIIWLFLRQIVYTKLLVKK